MLLELITSRRVVFFGGKGGVGKTTLASTTAAALARRGRRVLLVSTDPAHNLGHLWDTCIGDRVTALDPGLEAVEIDPDATVTAHLVGVEQTMHEMMPRHLHTEVSRHLRLSAGSPGTHEAAILERIARIVDGSVGEYDHVIVDTAPSGHTSRLMALPEVMSAWTDGLLGRRARAEKLADAAEALGAPSRRDRDLLGARGATGTSTDPVRRRNERLRSILEERRDLFRRFRRILTDPELCTFIIVLTAERMPVLETVELHSELSVTGVSVAACVVNRRSPRDQGDFLAARAELEEGFVSSLRDRLPDVPVIQLPLLPGEATSREVLYELGERLR
ncbi:ArsA family ATPase [Corynebacterium pygosceleis]|uniref:TRC40/GET3/ArsA family transport-energizing ATPase n=1 Tax=Corynebacterium pygosceleis TaxID=2800406 RepID=A0A9Q4GJH3_9CORY|nr:TRC40/GET3/ArsA family transport-energizing ATPase [Corynebacterium pygosceleis]MCK7637169.1 arsenical pump-driving ATPase GET3 [Corynebacterium pygosceleis]MCL0120056.1 arsenical pump-driving ATPase GET3 [Corynebacterium pygosceleis]MCX7469416.1 TRC40/GET3/ArsA family transport-energizing ATPase [Corynebacterium pygosceleis]